jgi:hypothetical protein
MQQSPVELFSGLRFQCLQVSHVFVITHRLP